MVSWSDPQFIAIWQMISPYFHDIPIRSRCFLVKSPFSLWCPMVSHGFPWFLAETCTVPNCCGAHIHVGTDCSDASTIGGRGAVDGKCFLCGKKHWLDFMGLFTWNMMGISLDLVRLNGRFCWGFYWDFMGSNGISWGWLGLRMNDGKIIGSWGVDQTAVVVSHTIWLWLT